MSQRTPIHVEFIANDGKRIATVIADAREFKTGSRGYGFYGRIDIDGKKHQVSLNIVEANSKNQQ